MLRLSVFPPICEGLAHRVAPCILARVPRPRKLSRAEVHLVHLSSEQRIESRCLFLVAERKSTNLMFRLLALIKEVLFRFAFGLCILMQLVLWALLAAGIEALFRSDSSFVMGLVIFLLLLGPFLIGAANFFI